MRLGVGCIHKLAGHEAVGDFMGKLFRLGDGALHALGALGEHQLRAVGLHQLAALHGHGLRHDDDDAVAPGRSHGGQTDAGVAGGGLDDDGTRLQHALRFRVVDHGLGDTVFYRTGGVEIFQLGQDFRGQVLVLFDVGQFHQRGMADQLVGGSIDLRHENRSFFSFVLIGDFSSGKGKPTSKNRLLGEPPHDHCSFYSIPTW